MSGPIVKELDERGLSSIDATCPHVSRAQKAAADCRGNEQAGIPLLGRHAEVATAHLKVIGFNACCAQDFRELRRLPHTKASCR